MVVLTIVMKLTIDRLTAMMIKLLTGMITKRLMIMTVVTPEILRMIIMCEK